MRERKNRTLDEAELSWIATIVAILRERPAWAEGEPFYFFQEKLASILPELKLGFNKAMQREIRDADVFAFTQRLAEIYRKRGTSAEVLRLIRKTPEPLHSLLDLEIAGSRGC